VQRFWNAGSRNFARRSTAKRRFHAALRKHDLIQQVESSRPLLLHLHSGQRKHASGVAEITLGGKVYPSPHPGFLAVFDELFFYTSRYYRVVERFLQELSEWPDFRMAGYRAQTLDAQQRCVMAGLLSRRPTRKVARELVSVIDAVRLGAPVAPTLLAQYQCCIRCAVPAEGAACHVPTEVRAAERMQHFLRRFAIPVSVKGKRLLVSWRRLLPLVDSPNPRVRQLFNAMILELHREGYRIGKI